MLEFLKNHPFAVEAHFERSTILTFAIDKDQLQHLIPECLELDTFNENLGFIAIAMVQTKALRPKGFPMFLGNNFFLIGYRIFVRYTNKNGKKFRGLYILKSETNKKRMEYLGNVFTKYSYTTTDINQTLTDKILKINSKKSRFSLAVEQTDSEIELPNNSPFENWKEAKRFAGPLPFTFNYNSKNKTVLIIEGVRKSWIPKPIKVLNYNFDFLKTMNLHNVTLANAFVIENVSYSWKKGKIEEWKN